MEQRHRDLLYANSFEITSDLRFRDIRGYLLDKGVLSGDNLNEIESKMSRVDQAKALLNILPTRGLHAFSVFRDALKLHYPHLARLLDDESQQEPLKGGSGETPEPRIFIIHAGEDKEHFVRPLVSALRQKGLKEDDIFFDEVSIKPGEHIRERIMSTLSSDALQLAVIVVSNSLLSKNYWPKLELEKCLNKKCVFPIWLDENEDKFKAFSELVGNYSPTLKQMSARRVQRTSVEDELANIATEVVQQLSAMKKFQPTAMQMLLYAAPISARSADSVSESSDKETGSKDDGTETDNHLLIEERLKEKKMETELEMLEKWGDIQLKLLEKASRFLSKEKVEQQTEEMFAQLRQKFDTLMVKVGCAIVHMIPDNLTDLDSFWAIYKSGQLNEELSHRLITDEMRAVVGQDLVVQVIMLEEQYWRWRKYLTKKQELQDLAETPVTPEPSDNTTSQEGHSEQGLLLVARHVLPRPLIPSRYPDYASAYYSSATTYYSSDPVSYGESLEELSDSGGSSVDNESGIVTDAGSEGSEDLSTMSLPGWHPHLPESRKYVLEAMAPYIHEDGWFLVRPIDHNRVAVSVTYNGDSRHFKIHRTSDNRYYFHRKQWRAQSINELINIYSVEGLQTSESRKAQKPPRTTHPTDEPLPLPPDPGQAGPPELPSRDNMVYLKYPIPVNKELEERITKKHKKHVYKN